MVGDTLLSVRGYQPMVVRMSPGGVIDSLRLNGFDSPMLARMRSHQLGLAYSPPLLISSVALSEGRYFVVNVRPGWLRVDVYDRTGQIEAILTEPTPSYDKSFYPTDIAVRRDRDHYLLAISVSRPVGSVRMYEWRQRH